MAFLVIVLLDITVIVAVAIIDILLLFWHDHAKPETFHRFTTDGSPKDPAR